MIQRRTLVAMTLRPTVVADHACRTVIPPTVHTSGYATTTNSNKKLTHWDIAAAKMRRNVAENNKVKEDVRRNDGSVGIKKPSTGSERSKQMTKLWDNLMNNVDEDFMKRAASFPRVNYKYVSKLDHIPVDSAFMTREFIDTSLYHPRFGYFSKQALIFSPAQPINFKKVKNDIEFSKLLEDLYKNLDDRLEDADDKMRQVWHTPTELFKPWFGYSMAKCIAEQHKQKLSAANKKLTDEPLLIYEVGAGNGTLMTNIVEYFMKYEPELEPQVEYKIIEISTPLSMEQNRKRNILVERKKFAGKIEIVNKSIFDYDTLETRDCHVVMTEVVDNFAHDVICYDRDTREPLQGVVCVDEDGDFKELFTKVDDELVRRYLQLSKGFLEKYYPSNVTLGRKIKRMLLPYSNTLRHDEKMFIPTGLLKLLDKLFECFPRHRLMLSDFDALPDAINGINGPVVQTRYNGNMVACSTYLVQPGYFDIFFPTNFELFKDMYLARSEEMDAMSMLQRKQLGIPHKQRKSQIEILQHREFLERYAMYKNTQLKSGENPMLSWYHNFKFLIT